MMQPKSVSATALILFCLIVALPIVSMYFLSLTGEEGLTFSHYQKIFSETRQIKLFFLSLILATGSALFSLVLGVPLAFFIERTNLIGRRVFKYLYLVPLLIPAYVNTIVWIHLLGKKGWLNLLLLKVFSREEPFFTIYGIGGAIFVLGISYFPFVTLLALSGLRSIDSRLEEAGRMIHSAKRVLKNITLPLIAPQLFAGASFVFIFSLANYGVPALLRVNTYPVEIFTYFSAFYNERAATAISFPLLLLTVSVILFQGKLMGQRSYVTIASGYRNSQIFDLKQAKAGAFLFSFIVIAVSVIVPLLVLFIKAGSPAVFLRAFRTSFNQIIESLITGLVSATAAVVLALILAYLIERAEGRLLRSVDVATLVPFAIPATVLGVGLIMVWNRPATEFIYASSIVVVFAHIGRFLPFAVRIMAAKLKQIDVSLEEAAFISGISWWRRQRRLLFPLMLPGFLAGWAIAFILSMGELDSTLLVLPPGRATLPIRIYTIMHYGDEKTVAALCLILVAFTLLPVLILAGLYRKVTIFERK